MPEYVNTADATAVPSDIKSGETAWARGVLLTGTQGFQISGTTLIVPDDWYVDGTTLVIPDTWLAKN